jgi:FtsH-binding integral membrane protein
MDYEEMNYQSYSRDRQLEASYAFAALMRKTYLWMSMALVITGLTAYVVATNAAISSYLFMHSQLIWVLFLAEIGLVIGLSAAIRKISLSTATLMFVAYSVINGALLSYIFLAYTSSSIATVFFITAGTFAAMAIVGYTTKTDLSSMGKYLLMALIGIIIATLVNVFFVKSTGFDLVISYAGVLIFVGLTAYDSQKIKQMLMQAPDAGEGTQKIALLGALSIYLDFINLFIYLLRIFGKRE